MNKKTLLLLAAISVGLFIVFSIIFLFCVFVMALDSSCQTYVLTFTLIALGVIPISALFSWFSISRILKQKLEINPRVCRLLYILDNVEPQNWTISDKKKIWKHPFREPERRMSENKFHLKTETAIGILIFVSCATFVLVAILYQEIVTLPILGLIFGILSATVALTCTYWALLGSSLSFSSREVLYEFMRYLENNTSITYTSYSHSGGWRLRPEFDSYKLEYERSLSRSKADDFMSHYSKNAKLRKCFKEWLHTGKVSDIGSMRQELLENRY